MFRRQINRPRAKLLSLGIVSMILLNLSVAPHLVQGQPDLSLWQTSHSDSWQVVIALAEGTNADQVAEKFEAEVVHRGPLHYATLELNKTSNLQQVLEELKETSGVIGAEQNYCRTISALPSSSVPKDSLFKEQWSMVNGNVQGAWDRGATGLGVTIAIVDTGVALRHPDLRENLLPGYNSIAESEVPGATQDDNGHGTHVSGIAAATRNGVGIVGVAYQAKIMPIKAIDSTGEGYDDAIAEGIVWAADHGAMIINLSIGLGNGVTSDVLATAINYAYDKGCLLVAASGNRDPELSVTPVVTYPASNSKVLAIVATDKSGKVTDYSATGPEIALAAPGDDIVSTWWSQTEGLSYNFRSGTSMAVPFVSGEAALIWSKHLEWTRQQVVQVLRQGTEDLGTPGRDNQYGYGLVDVNLALSIATQTPDTVTSQESLTILPQTIEKAVAVSLKTMTIPSGLMAVSVLSHSAIPASLATLLKSWRGRKVELSNNY